MENQFKGTKGKWIIDHKESSINEYGIAFKAISNESKTKISLADIYGDDEEAKANALLISKSPEMLEMLIEFQTMCDKRKFPTESELMEMGNKAKQLIKEATEI